MNMKKNLAIAAAVALLAVPALGATSANASEDTGYIPAKSESQIPSYFRTGYDNTPGVGEDQYNSSFNKAVGAVDANKGPVTVTRNGHTMTIDPEAQIPGKITEVDGQPVTSKAQVLSLLNGSNKSNNAEQNTTESNQVQSNNGVQNNTESSQNQSNNDVQNGKLAQTGESNTGAKAGIVGAIAAMVSVAFAGVEKFFKRA